MADLLAHALDLALASLVDGQLEGVGTDPAHAGRRGASIVELDPGPERSQGPLRNRGAANHRAVGLLHLKGRMRQTVGQLAVVGEQDQTGGIDVQSPDGIEPQLAGHKRDDGGPALRIARGADHAGRFVDGVDDQLGLDGHGATIEAQRIRRFDVAGWVEDRLAVNRHAPGADQLLGGAPRGDPGSRQMLGQSHGPATIVRMDMNLLEERLRELDQPSYRGGQIWKWAAQGAAVFDSMTDLPLPLRAALSDSVPFSTLTVEHEARARDGTVKALFSTHDGRPVEAVLMRYRDGRRSLCLSSQSGCPLTCTFCATGQMRFGRNLTTWEIIDQALHFRRLEQVDHAVFMGMGEPMLNLDSVLAACRRLPDIGITHRRTAISTVGWIPGIERLAEQDMPLRLAISLHAADPALRSELMPVNDRYPLQDVIAACRAYYERKRRQVFVEYVMLGGVNDSHVQAVQLAELLDRRVFKVNLIPYNPTGSDYVGSTPKAMDAFKAELERHGLSATVRLTRGRDIAAACGQLAAR